MENFGTIYIFSIIFTIIGMIESFKKDENLEFKYSWIFNIWFIVSIILTFICIPNINRLNIIMIPVIYYTIIGIYVFTKERRKLAIIIGSIYLIFFILFIKEYISQNWNDYSTFENGLKEVIEYVDEIPDKEIYITNDIKEPYIYVLFYTEYNTKDFVNTVKYENEYVEYRQVEQFGKYHFIDIIDDLDTTNNVYVVKKEKKDNYNLGNYNIKEFDNYIIIEGKN